MRGGQSLVGRTAPAYFTANGEPGQVTGRCFGHAVVLDEGAWTTLPKANDLWSVRIVGTRESSRRQPAGNVLIVAPVKHLQSDVRDDVTPRDSRGPVDTGCSSARRKQASQSPQRGAKPAPRRRSELEGTQDTVTFWESRGRVLTRVAGRIAFPSRRDWRRRQPRPGETWIVQVAGASVGDRTLFLRPLSDGPLQ